MRNAARTLVAALVLTAACGSLVVTLGEGILPSYDVDVRIDRSFEGAPLDQCPVGEHTVTQAGNGESLTVDVAAVDGGCSISFAKTDLLLFDEDLVRQSSDRLQGRRIEGVVEAAVVVTGFSLTDDDTGADVDLASEVSSLTVQIDEATLLDRQDVIAVQSGPVRKVLPQSVVDELIAGINDGTPVTADVSVELVFPSEALADLPQVLHLVASLQPEVLVDAVQAASSLQ